ncbi:MAG TPA: hypothetical protein VMO52_01275, partial [Acidimicrobiia bacterium]|nr:hypothetical protein [Acidimicrobiia bacterium]
RAVPENLEEINQKLLDRRNLRVRPGLDDKVVAAWNGMAIRAFAEAGAALGDSEYLEAARAAAAFVRDAMTVEGIVMRSWKDGEHSVPGFLDDYAGVAVGLQALYQATGDVEWFIESERLIDKLRGFEGRDRRLYTTTSAEGLVKRPRDIADNPAPSGNALAAEALLVSSLFTGNLDIRDRSIAALGSIGDLAARYPSMVSHHLAVATSIHVGTRELAVVGPDREELVAVFWSSFRPEVVIAPSDDADDRIPLLEGRGAIEGRATAYLCHNFVCDLSTTDPAALSSLLGGRSGT